MHETYISRLLAKMGYQRVLVLECSFDQQVDATPARIPVVIRRLDETDVENFVVFRQGPPASVFLDRLALGYRCYAAVVEGVIVSVSWVAVRKATLWLLYADFELDDDELYVYDSYTHPDYRGLRIQAPIFDAIRSDLKAAGFRCAMTFVEPENVANLKSRGRLGFQAVGIERRLRLGRFVKYFRGGKAPILVQHSGGTR